MRVTFQLLDYDAKRMHYFEQLFHASEGWVSATSENMSLHVDMAAKKTAPFPDSVAACLGRMQAAHARLPRPEAAGRRIAMPGKELTPLHLSPARALANVRRRCHLVVMRFVDRCALG